MLLAYCSSRLDSLNTNIQQYFTAQQKRTGEMNEAAKLLEIMGRFNGVSDGKILEKNEAYRKDHVAMANDLIHLYANSQNPDVRAKAAAIARSRAISRPSSEERAQEFTMDTSTRPSDQGQRHAQLRNSGRQVEAVKNVQSSLSKNAELDMIQLQSLVSQRQRRSAHDTAHANAERGASKSSGTCGDPMMVDRSSTVESLYAIGRSSRARASPPGDLAVSHHALTCPSR